MVDPQTLDEVDVLTRTVYGEARGESEDGQAAVAWVIRNRVAKGRRYMGKTIKEVCLQPSQFSCWNSNDPNRNLLLRLNANSEPYKNIRKIVEQVLNGTRTDNTQGSTHYHTSRVKPNWANDKIPVVTIGNHLFYNNID
jgi:spore germination cell wall hydrolase CwlJ-like protein